MEPNSAKFNCYIDGKCTNLEKKENRNYELLLTKYGNTSMDTNTQRQYLR